MWDLIGVAMYRLGPVGIIHHTNPANLTKTVACTTQGGYGASSFFA
jgi:hypothetical protein